MKTLFGSLLLLFLSFSLWAQEQQPLENSTYYELRIYTAHPGKLQDLVKRFENHTRFLFEKAGMKNIAYFLPNDPNENKLYYILGYPDKESRDPMWQKFLNDPDWKKAYEESRKNGPLVQSIQEIYMVPAPGLNEKAISGTSGIFQLRTYTCFDNKLPDLEKRFKNHTQDLFAKQGLVNYPYFETVEKDGSQPKLVYLLGHQDLESFEQAFSNFIKDPDWIKARDESEKNGKIVERVDAVFLKTIPFSPLK